ncbi:hypothetical protein ACHWQZ_G012784 [Mnemiopsis leidyi]
MIEKSDLPLKFVSVKQSHQILKDLGLQVGWYVLFKQATPHVYPLCIVLNSEVNGDKKIHTMRVVNREGYFMVDENPKKKKTNVASNDQVCKYRSLEGLLNSIQIRVCNKKLLIRPTQIVTEEMISDMRKNKIFFSDADPEFHKQPHVLSLFCIHLIPNSMRTRSLCTSFTGHWMTPQSKLKSIRAFLYDKKHMEKDSLTNIARIAEISGPEFVHENILKCYGYADDGLNTIYYIHEQFGLEFSDTFVQDYNVGQLYEFGRQIKNGLQFLHDRDIVHGFPALQNVYINSTLKQVKLGKIGILSAIMHASEVQRSDEASSTAGSFLKVVKYPQELNELLVGWFSQKRVRMLHEYPEEKLQESWDSLEDIAHQSAEILNYIYLQSTDDLKNSDNHTGKTENIARVMAVQVSELGIVEASESFLNKILPVSGYPSVSVREIVQPFSKCLLRCCKDVSAEKLKLINSMTEKNRRLFVFNCSSESKQLNVEVTKSALIVDGSDIPLTQIDKVQFNFKHHSAVVFTNRNSRIELSFNSRTSLESFLTLLDIAYKIASPGNFVLDHKLSDGFHSESLVYHDPEYVIPVQADQKTRSPFNYSLVDHCSLVRKIENEAEAESILRFPGNESKFLVTDNYLVKEPAKIVNQYYFYMVIEDSLISRTVAVIGGRFQVDAKRGYLSLFKLFTQIESSYLDKKEDVKKKWRFVDNVTCEDIMYISEQKFVYGTKREPTLSPVNVALTTCPTSHHYLYTRYSGVLHSPKSIKPISVTQFITHNLNYGSSILVPLIEHVKNLQINKVKHENVAEFVGVYRVNHMPCIVEDAFSCLLNVRLSSVQYSSQELYHLGKQIVSGLRYLHERKIVHGFPAMHNISICPNEKVKLRFVGILPELIKRRDVYNPLLLRDYLPHVSSFGHPARWLHRSMIFSNAPWNIEVDRYVFGCTLWQLYNKGAVPLPDRSDQEILEKLEGKDCSWFNGGAYFRLPNCDTEFLNKLQKIICVCVTWGNKDNLEKYEFRKIAEAYEALSEVVNIEEPTSSDFILKAGNGRLDFDVNLTEPSSKYTLVEEDDNKRVVLVSSKKSNLPTTSYEIGSRLRAQNTAGQPSVPAHMGGQLTQVKDLLVEKGKLLQLSDLQQPDGGRFLVPLPGSPKVEAICSRFSLSKNVWVKSYSKCKDIPEQHFIEEVKNLLKFEHPNIVPLKGCVLLDETLLLITPFYRYKSLSNFLDNNSHNVNEKQRESYALQICAGMKYLSQNKCVHRNLRLEHVYMTNLNDVVITNFGLARVTEALYYQQRTNMASDTFVIYPPEVISVLSGGGKVKFNSACDVWSYGVLLWELYSGDIAYQNVVSDLHGYPDINLLHQYFSEGNCLEADQSWPANIRTVIEKCLTEEQTRISFFGIEEILSGP